MAFLDLKGITCLTKMTFIFIKCGEKNKCEFKSLKYGGSNLRGRGRTGIYKAPLCSSLSWSVDGPVSAERLPLGASLQCGQVAAGVGSEECMSRMSAALVGWPAGPLPERGLSVWPAGASWEHGGLRVVGLFHGSCPAHSHGAKLLTTHPGTSDSTASYGPESKSWPPQIPVGGVYFPRVGDLGHMVYKGHRKRLAITPVTL